MPNNQIMSMTLNMIVAGFLAMLGLLGCIVGIVFTIPFVYSAMVVAYETLCNPPPKAG